MDGFQAAVLNVKMKYLDEWTAKRQACAELYSRVLNSANVRIPRSSGIAMRVSPVRGACREPGSRSRGAGKTRGADRSSLSEAGAPAGSFRLLGVPSRNLGIH